jgi:phospholipid-binding lipoprotein MlaA
MLTAHLALAALTAAPASDHIVAAPMVVPDSTLSAQQKGGAAALLVSLAPPPPKGGEIPGFRYFVSGFANATNAPEVVPGSSVADPPAPIESAPAVPSVDIAVPAHAKPDPAASLDDIDLAAPKAFPDPLEPINRISYAISQPIDQLILRPAAMAYKAVIPKPARDGARNAIANFSEPIVFINDVIQLRPDRAIRTLGRFLINSILGLGGIFDIAKRKPFNIKHHSNGFADTLGYYGIGPIIYVYLPVLGPTTLRDSAGSYGDSYFWDRNLHKLIYPDSRSPYFRTQPKLGKSGTIITVIDGLDQRAENDDDLRHIKEDSIDPYAALRADFLQDRAGEIAELRAKDGEAPANSHLDDPLLDPEGTAPEPAPGPTPAP